jgi:hypothetical protein
MRRYSLYLVILLSVLTVRALGQESQLQAEFRLEGKHFAESCKPAHASTTTPGAMTHPSFVGCLEVFFTGHPLHIAVGSIAPQNGFGAGPAFVTHWTPDPKDKHRPIFFMNYPWRLNFNADGIVSSNGSWRAGVYGKAVHIPEKKGHESTTAPTSSGPLQPDWVLHVYAQATSLNKIAYYGLGPATTRPDASFFGERETIVGMDITYPIGRTPALKRLNLSLFGEANGRFVDLRESGGQASPSIEKVYTEATAPGLTSQPAFAQFSEAILLRPKISNLVRFNYSLKYQQYFAPGDSRFSFQRLTVDLAHQILLSRKTRELAPLEHNGPDDCATSATDSKHQCTPFGGPTLKPNPSDPNNPKRTYDREGSINLRFLLSESYTSSGHIVPFYFQPTLGGSDINGKSSLASFQDYRFRAPNLMLLQGSIEHSLPRLPIGAVFMAETGKVALTRSDIEFKHLRHSYAAGLTLRAGGFPMVYLMFAWGSKEGTHTIASINTSLLGGSSRPSLY